MDNTPNFPSPDFENENLPKDFAMPVNLSSQPMYAPFPPPPVYAQGTPSAEIDPDNPHWSSLGGVGVWLASVAALVIIPSVVVVLWYFIEQARGHKMPMTSEEITQWAMTPTLLLIQIGSTIGAHLVTLAICWAVASRMGKISLKESLGWHWKGPSPALKVGIILGTVVITVVVLSLLPRIIPDSKTTPFAEMLKASNAVRYVVAFLAVFTAPLVEEFVYRGMLYSPLKRAIGMGGAVAVATSLFALVHVPQYWGAWGSLTGLLLLSFALTVIRAKTKSIFPCVAIHTLFNSVGAIGILFGTGS
jgi:membrane protease YdiL (CAAX protease family)